MKTKLLLLFLIFCYGFAYSQWELRYPDIPTDFINDMVFTSFTDGYFVNSGGSVYKTTDGGSTWINKRFIADDNFYRIRFIDEQTGFTFARKNVVQPGDIPLIYTTDAGNSWLESQIALWGYETFLPVNLNILIRAQTDIETLNNFYGNWDTTYNQPTFIWGDSILSEELSYGSILELDKLNDGSILALGNSWQAKYYNIIDDSVSYILKSVDNGLTWDTLWCDFPYELKSCTFINNTTGWLAGESERIYKTTDGGVSWFLQFADTTSLYQSTIEQIFAVDEQNIYASTLSGLLISNDGGANWYNQSFPGINSLKVFFKDPLNGFAYGTDLLYTADGGFNWYRVSSSIKDDIVKVDFVDKVIGWALSYSKVYHTTNGGYSWTEQLSFEGVISNQLGLKFLNQLKGWIVTYNSAYSTIDGGLSWDSISVDNGFMFFGGDIEFFNDQLGVMCNIFRESVPGSHIYDIPGVLVTTDGGNSWNTIEYTINAEYSGFKKLRFIKPDTLWAINNKGIWLSNDTAKTWQNIYSTNYFLGSYSFDFINSTDGCFSDVGSSFNFTTDAGQYWQQYDVRKYIFIQDYQIVGKNIFNNYRIFAVGNKGRLLKYTLNDFNPDHYPATYTGNNLYSLSLYMEDRLPHLWAAGDGFTIVYGTTELVTGVENTEESIPVDFYLSQNYPNPFNPITNIDYQIPNSSFITLKVYDILGNKVATLVNEEKPAGNYNVEFNGSNLASGIYFYQMKAGNFNQTCKMIILK